MVEDAGRGWRQVVPSPKPDGRSWRTNTVKALVNAGTSSSPSAAAVSPSCAEDRQLSRARPPSSTRTSPPPVLAELLDADMLVILTAVEKVAINFGKPDQKGLDDLTPDEARKYMRREASSPPAPCCRRSRPL